MSTGISIASINRIKELAEEKKFAQALEILDTQNLDKSINPQFLRISGEIFRENKRYYDSRKYLMKAHQMSPQGTRIIYELIQLYLELGYYTRAQKYYEEYMFYVAPEDTLKEYVEYTFKKSQGADVKDIAAILIPILERMPDDRWNFEAVLLYDKMDRKDKALEECQYILEHYKDSVYIDPVIQYIDDQLDVDQYFYQYPKEEQPEDKELFGDLIAQEDAILEADYLRMYPPEARIMVEADDKDGVDAKPVKEKKKKKKKQSKKKEETDASAEEISDSETKAEITSEDKPKASVDEEQKAEKDAGDDHKHGNKDVEDSSENEQIEEASDMKTEEEQRKEEREAALEKILSKKVDKDVIKATAKHVAQSVKDIDTSKAKLQVKNVAETLKDNVAKATESFGEVVAAKIPESSEALEPISEEFVDGIIESVLDPPKKTVGQVVMNEELDALIPDSLEAMSAQEVADIEAKKEEEERLELEALEASVRLEEEKKEAKKEAKLRRKNRKASETETSDDQVETADDIENSEDRTENVIKIPEDVVVQEGMAAEVIATVSFEELKARFLADNKEEEPLDSLGFMSVVQSDVDSQMKEDIPQEAEMLHRMIDNKEYYSGEDSTDFESRESYQDSEFEVEDYTFRTYEAFSSSVLDGGDVQSNNVENLLVKEIYAEEPIVDFDEMIPPVEIEMSQQGDFINEDTDTLLQAEGIQIFEEEIAEEDIIAEEITTEAIATEEIPAEEITTEEITTEAIATEEMAFSTGEISEMIEDEEPVENEKEEAIPSQDETAEESWDVQMEVEQSIQSPDVQEQMQQPVDDRTDRDKLRVRIILTDAMLEKLSVLKESGR